jgi:thymidylate synthase (FAD)
MNEVKLIAITKPVGLEKTDQAADLIAYCARVSNPSNQDNFDTAEKLLSYCVRKQHWSIFEMAHVVLEIKTTRDIARQILRHRSFSFQEFSQRYAAVDTSEFTLREARLQDPKNRQNSIENEDNNLQLQWETRQAVISEIVKDYYEWALKQGIAKEQARVILPEGLTPSTMYMAGTLRSWIHYCNLRTGNGTQKEHQEIAAQCWEILQKEFEFLGGLND